MAKDTVAPGRGRSNMYIQFGREFGSTIEKYNKAGIGPWIKKRVDKFVEFKKENPTEMFGANDKPFATNSPYKGLYNAHLTGDDSVVYKYVADENRLYVLGVYSHNDLGTDKTHPSQPKQHSVGNRLQVQVPESDESITPLELPVR